MCLYIHGYCYVYFSSVWHPAKRVPFEYLGKIMSEIKVSVIVPIYNAERYLTQCLRYLKRQTLKEIEFICVDNCSQDASREILEKETAGDDRFTLIYQDVNRGQANSVNRALDIARGEYVAECDADDYALPAMYRILSKYADGCDIVKCDFMCKTEGQVTSHRYGFREGIFRPMDLPTKERSWFLRQWPHLMSAIYRKEFLLENGLRYREGPNYEDTCLLFKLNTMAKTYRYIPVELYVYRRDNPGSGTATIRDTYAICEQCDEIARWNREHDLGLEKDIAVLRWQSYKWNLGRLNEDESVEFLERAAADFEKDDADPEYFMPWEWEAYKTVRG